MNKKPLSLNRLITASLLGSIFGGKISKVGFPRTIDDYKFKKIFKTEKSVWTFSFALYENSVGKIAIAKMWNGRIKDFAYYTLENELTLYEILNKALDRLGESKRERLGGIRIPRLLGKKETKNTLLILSEFIKGKKADKLSSERSLEIYFKTLDFLDFLGNKLTVKEKSQIAHRDGYTLLLLYFPLLIKAILAHPYLSWPLIRGVPVFLASVPKIIKRNKKILTHRDLHLENIILTKTEVVLIDLQFCLFSDPIYDLISSLRSLWDNNALRLGIIRELGKRSKNDTLLIKGLMVHSATHGLTDKRFSEERINRYHAYLGFAIERKPEHLLENISRVMRFKVTA